MRGSVLRVAVATLLLGALTFTSARESLAHLDPSPCGSSSPNGQLFVMFFDGSDATGATFTPCESIHYMAKVCPAGGNTCDLQGDAQTTWTITAPDGVVHNVMPPGGIPLITGTSGCVNSLVVDYTMNVAGPFLGGSMDLTEVVTHSGATDLRSYTGTGIYNDKGTCPASTQCADSVCDPDVQFMDGLINRRGMCRFENKALGTPCEADGDRCTIDHCDGAGHCVPDHNVSCQAPVPPCEGGQHCEPSTGQCVDNPDAPASTSCGADGNKCTVDRCDGAGKCVNVSRVTCPGPVPPCEGGQHCEPSTGQCVDNPDAPASTSCEADGNLCTVDRCDGGGKCVNVSRVTCPGPVPPCEGGQHCDRASGRCVDNPDAPATTVCDADADSCTLDHCDGAGHCVFQQSSPACALGCRITGDGIGCDVKKSANCSAEVSKATFGGQVGAACGCIGPFDEFGRIEGNWTYSWKHRRGGFHATDFNSLVCGCDGDFTNGLCSPGKRPRGQEPPQAPANMACFSGLGEYSPTGEKRTLTVAFRVDVEDRSEPGGVHGAPPPDVYRIRIWIPVPSSGETAGALAVGACCTNATPTGKAARRPDIDDGGDLLHGHLQIHPELGHSAAGVCPEPSGRCAPYIGER